MPIQTLTPLNVRSLVYRGTSVNQYCVYWDVVLPCFGVRVYPSGRSSYVCAYRLDARKRLAVLGRVDVLTLDAARHKALAYLRSAASHADPGECVRHPVFTTLDDLCTAYIENYARKKRVCWRSDASSLQRHLPAQLRRRLAATVVSADIEPLHAAIGTLHPSAANHFLEVVRGMFNWGKVAGLVPQDQSNPTAGIRRFARPRRKRYITLAEMPSFIKALEAEDAEYARHAIWLLLLLGMRSVELLNAKWTDIDWDASTLCVGMTKNGEPLLSPLSDAAVARLKCVPRMAGNPHIICGLKPGRPLTDLGGPLKRILRRAHLENIHVHDLRRTVGSWLAQAGLSLHLIGDVLNHRDLRTTLGYAYFQTQQRRDALNGHADKVLPLAAAHLRLEPGPNALTLDNVLQPDAPPSRHRHYFKREALHELVWTAPVSEVSSRLGVSGVGLAKLCRRAAIPLPGRGYWARVDAGQRINRTPLPSPPAWLPDMLRIRGMKPVQ